ncbi:MAG: M20/M25/M40 family metallo-hydrolase [Planctomycetes bacterium]|nr:M20/M25/M40 family metallo-hydrolase [Planctomycetota bacterium]
MKADTALLLAAPLLCFSCALQAQRAPFLERELARETAPKNLGPDLGRACGLIRPADAYNTCKWLALPRYAGRYPGTPEYRQLCEWAASCFAEWGLEPAGDAGGFLQAYPSPYTLVHEGSLTLEVPAPEGGPGAHEQIVLEPGKDFLPLLFSDSGEAEGEVVFAGWGISAPDLGYDDYQGVDVRGRFVACFRGTPDVANRAFEEHDQHRTRMRTAQEKGAVGLLYIYPEVSANPNGDLVPGFLPAMISEAEADRLLAAGGNRARDLRAVLSETRQPRSFATGARARLKVQAEHFPDAVAHNVIGWVPGADAALRGECVIVGAHLDHCGRHLGLLFAGADDNASGSACVLQAARAASALERRPRRSLVFVLFGGEERGLMGSRQFVDHLPPCVERLAAMINLDMEGEGDGVGAVLRPGFPELREAVERADAAVGAVRQCSEFEGPPGVRSSDYAPFYFFGAPCIAFWANGPHLHYHQPGDTIYRINPDMLADVARLAFLTAFYIADREP